MGNHFQNPSRVYQNTVIYIYTQGGEEDTEYMAGTLL